MNESLQQLLQHHQIKAVNSGKYISQEFQDYAYRMAMQISTPEDRETISLCMRLAKKKPRAVLDSALSFVSDATAKNKVALFLWKIGQIEADQREKKAAAAKSDTTIAQDAPPPVQQPDLFS